MWSKVNDNIKNVREILDESVYGHNNAKRQLERIIGQWMNGEHTGYCFGFEGPPGVGKTSLAKNGLANCLKDENDVARPFSFIALGGSSNGSTLSGHSYTYVGSTWGRIVDILMEQKCMNPIIFIDELDKVSKTEHGKEIIGILTHMVDPTQNEHFQDKYFSGIDFNLSRVLFIFSYNNPELIDPILLDRIHRIKFKNLSLEDKVIITKKHILPELFKRVGLTNSVEFSDDIIKYIIENYTKEAGVRKLKEILFEIISEINLEIIQSTDEKFYHYVLTEEDIKNKYLKERLTVRYKEIHDENRVGIINGLWANALGMGGIIPIESNYFPSAKMLELKLTGMQGDVMKESMNVAMTLAWKLSCDKTQKAIMKENSKNNLKGIHIHCPEGAVPKDGPSAGTAITCCIYSLLNKKPINRLYAITGEIDLQGNITAIGGLDLKILGGIRAGVKHFIYPHENKKDFDKFLELYKDNDIINNIEFFSVKHITEVLKMIF
jgi:endopeptidase La